MDHYGYDKTYKPPIPVCNIIVSANLPLEMVEKSDHSAKVTMLIDTGADTSIIPKSAVQELEALMKLKLPYEFVKIVDFNGQVSTHKRYELSLRIDCSGVEKKHTLNIVEIEGNEAILGRDVLNRYIMCLNGPELTWTLESP